MKDLRKVLIRCKENVLKLKGLTLGRGSHLGFRCSLEGVRNISIGEACYLGNDCRVACFEVDGRQAELKIGSRTLLTNGVNILCAESVVIGNDCMLAAYSSIVDEDHGIDLNLGIPYEKQRLKTAPVVIGNNVWIGQKACILKGVNIGDNCIVGAGSVVTRDLPPNCIAVGNPAKVIKRWNGEKWEKVFNE